MPKMKLKNNILNLEKSGESFSRTYMTDHYGNSFKTNFHLFVHNSRKSVIAAAMIRSRNIPYVEHFQPVGKPMLKSQHAVTD